MKNNDLLKNDLIYNKIINSKNDLKNVNKNSKKEANFDQLNNNEDNEFIKNYKLKQKEQQESFLQENICNISSSQNTHLNDECYSNEEMYSNYNTISCKEMSDEEISSENEYNTKIAKKIDKKPLKSETIKLYKNSKENDQTINNEKKKNSYDDSFTEQDTNNNSVNEQIYTQNNTQINTKKYSNDVDKWICKLFKCECLQIEEVKLMCELLINILKEEENCVYVNVPIIVVGDIHGQFYDLLELFHIGSLPPDVSYLFLGDYVDRGYYSCECFCLVACMKIKYPRNVTMLRGNHESRQITKVYGFYDECMRKYNNDGNAWKYMTDAFDYLPLTAIINNQIFCDHGGISPHLNTLSDINKLDRFNEIPQEGIICDLLWSDPACPDDDILEGCKPSPRGAGVLFSEEATKTFLHTNNLNCICRAHQLVQDGYQWMHNDKVVTIFSAPNYCYRCGNAASLMFVDEFMEKTFVTFDTAPLRASAQALRRSVDYML